MAPTHAHADSDVMCALKKKSDGATRFIRVEFITETSWRGKKGK